MRNLRALGIFVRWVLPEGGCSLRLYTNLLRILLYGRQSVYSHFKSVKAASLEGSLKAFLNSLASALTSGRSAGQNTVPARLLARLLRTIYLTEVLPRKDTRVGRAGASDGYAAHPQFSYGESLAASTRARTRDGHLE